MHSVGQAAQSLASVNDADPSASARKLSTHSIEEMQVVAEDGSSCECASGFRQTYTADKFTADDTSACVACPAAVSQDGLRCVACDTTSGVDYRPAAFRSQQCECTDNADGQGVITDRSAGGQLLLSDDGEFLQRCFICASAAAPDVATGTCEPCEYPQVSEGGRCVCPKVVPSGSRCTNAAPLTRVAAALGINLGADPLSATATQYSGDVATQVRVSGSAALAEHLASAAAACLDEQDRQACNTLGNLCVLQRYQTCALPTLHYGACTRSPSAGSPTCSSLDELEATHTSLAHIRHCHLLIPGLMRAALEA